MDERAKGIKKLRKNVINKSVKTKLKSDLTTLVKGI